MTLAALHGFRQRAIAAWRAHCARRIVAQVSNLLAQTIKRSAVATGYDRPFVTVITEIYRDVAFLGFRNDLQISWSNCLPLRTSTRHRRGRE
jgi:hypothetical protein